MRVLAIVDDTPDVRRLVRVLLERAGALVDAEAASVREAMQRLDPDAQGVVILDQDLDGDITGLEGAALLRSCAPGARIVLFTALDLSGEAERNPSIDAFVRKDRVLELPRIVQQLSDEMDRSDEVPVHKMPSEADRLLRVWLTTPSLLFGDLPPLREAADVTRHLVEPGPDRSAALLRLVAAAGDVDRAVAHLLALRQVIERAPSAYPSIDVEVLDLLVVEVTSNVIASARRAAMIDPLTGIGNRRALERDLATALARSERMRQALTVGYFDLIGLKAINDRLGHEEGDRFLRSFARALDVSKRASDGSYRVGGDEFVVVLPDTTGSDASGFIERLKAAEAPEFSWGQADTTDVGYDAARLVRLADIRLLGERYGRNRGHELATIDSVGEGS